MSIESIPEEVLFKAAALGHLPEEYVEPAAHLIEEASKTQDIDELAATIDEILPKFTDFATDFLFRRLFKAGNEKIKNAALRSRLVNAWIRRNREMLMASLRAK